MAKDKPRTTVLRAMLADISYVEKNEKAGKAISDLDVVQILQKSIARRKDAIAQFVCKLLLPLWIAQFVCELLFPLWKSFAR